MNKITIIIVFTFNCIFLNVQVRASCCDSVGPTVRSVLNPTMPYTELLPGTLNPGDSITIEASTKQDADAFNVNFATGPDLTDDIGFHMSFRFKQGVVVRNWRKDNSWDSEQRSSIPIKAGDQFTILIECHDLEYKISINGYQFTNYPYKISLKEIRHLTIDNRVQISSIKFEGFVSLNCEKNIINNSSMNFVKHLPLGLRPSPGQKFIIEGSTKPDAKVFIINLASGSGDEDDMGLHISVRFKEGAIVRNWRKNSNWNAEERSGGVPFKAGDSFKIVIFCEKDQYKININGEKFADFPYHIPLGALTYMIIDHDIQISSIGFEHQCCTDSAPVLNPSIPYARKLPVKLDLGRIIRIQGDTNSNANRFHVNLAIGSNFPDRNDTGLHISVRFNNGIVVINWLKDGTWGAEERGAKGTMPIQAGRSFEILIFCDLDEYEIRINSEYFATYPYKIPIEKLTYLLIDGDVRISKIVLETPQTITC